jgi:hypothetical protein
MIWLLILIAVIAIGGFWFAAPLMAMAAASKAIPDKPAALQRIAGLMQEHQISLDEVAVALNSPAVAAPALPARAASDIAKTLFSYLGAIFILAGISTYIGMFWDSMGSAMRILVTLGVGYVLLVVLVAALHEKKYPRLEAPLVIATAFMLTSGWFVLIHELFPAGDNWRKAAAAVFALMTLHQAALLYRYRLTLLVLTALFFAYSFMQVGLDLLDLPGDVIAITLGISLFVVATELNNSRFRVLAELALLIATVWLNAGLFDRMATLTDPNLSALVTGVCLMSTAFGLQRAQQFHRLNGLGYFAGSLMLYAALFDQVRGTQFELLYLAATAAMLYACVQLQSRALLLTTVLAMLGFIGYFGAQHFADSLGWPITLVLMGVAFFGVSALAMKVRRQM